MIAIAGCATRVPIYTWTPSGIDIPAKTSVGLAPVAGPANVTGPLQKELLAQRPAAKADIAVYTPENLAERFPVRLASTASLSNSVAAIYAARQSGVDVLLVGEVVESTLQLIPVEQQEKPKPNMNELFFQRLGRGKDEKEIPDQRIVVSWNAIDVPSGKTLGNHVVNLTLKQALQEYVDLDQGDTVDPQVLLTACARESWKAISPSVYKQEVKLARTYLLPHSWSVRNGIQAAKIGEWEIAQQHWEKASKGWLANPAALHNLAISDVAREDFEMAKFHVRAAAGWYRHALPSETLFWVDSQQKAYHRAHQLPRPDDGWLIPDAASGVTSLDSVKPVDVHELPWWTAIPLAKPPHWSWGDWLQQPFRSLSFQ